MTFKRPMLAYTDTPEDFNAYREHLPLWGSFKLDGIRAVERELMVSRTLKKIPSAYAQGLVLPEYFGFDGELLIKPREINPGETIYHLTYSAVMTHGCTEPLDWWIFDHTVNLLLPYRDRYAAIQEIVAKNPHPDIKVLEQRPLNTPAEIMEMEKEALDLGYEGLIVRKPDAPYHCNRSSWKQGYLMKVVRTLTSTAKIDDIYEMMHNDNEATTDARGFTVRSTHKANLRPSGMLGGFHCTDIESGIQFKCGLGEGIDHAFRTEIFRDWPKHKGWFFDYEYKPYGTKDKPRQPKWKRWRDPIDVGIPT